MSEIQADNYDVPSNLPPEVYMDSQAKGEFVIEVTDRLKNTQGTILDLGSGKLPVTSALAGEPGRQIIGIDKDVRTRLDTGMGVDFVQGDLTKEGIENIVADLAKPGEVKGVVVADLLGYLPNWQDVLRQGSDMLADDGQLILFHKVGRGDQYALDRNLPNAPKSPADIQNSLSKLGSSEMYVYEGKPNSNDGRFVKRDAYNPSEKNSSYMFVLDKGK